MYTLLCPSVNTEMGVMTKALQSITVSYLILCSQETLFELTRDNNRTLLLYYSPTLENR